MTREELLNQLAKQRARKTQLAWAQFAAAVGAADAGTKAAILDAVNHNNARGLAPLVLGIATAKKLEIARAVVDAAAADDSLTVDELITILS